MGRTKTLNPWAEAMARRTCFSTDEIPSSGFFFLAGGVGPAFLFDMGVVVLLVGPAACELDLSLKTVLIGHNRSGFGPYRTSFVKRSGYHPDPPKPNRFG